MEERSVAGCDVDADGPLKQCLRAKPVIEKWPKIERLLNVDDIALAVYLSLYPPGQEFAIALYVCNEIEELFLGVGQGAIFNVTDHKRDPLNTTPAIYLSDTDLFRKCCTAGEENKRYIPPVSLMLR
jgi:hypothetical protein